MKKMLLVLLATLGGCAYPAYTVRKPLPSQPPLSREELERLSIAGISEPVMMELIEKRGALPLTPDDLVALKNAGAPDPVVQKAIATERKIVERVIVEDYYGYPYTGTSFSYGVGFGYGGYYYGGYPRGYFGVRVYR
jgi:hypothetical protein